MSIAQTGNAGMMGGKVGPLSCEISDASRKLNFGRSSSEQRHQDAIRTPTALYISQQVSGHIAHPPLPISCILYRISWSWPRYLSGPASKQGDSVEYQPPTSLGLRGHVDDGLEGFIVSKPHLWYRRLCTQWPFMIEPCDSEQLPTILFPQSRNHSRSTSTLYTSDFCGYDIFSLSLDRKPQVQHIPIHALSGLRGET